jgi:hypothetical protein
MDLMMRDEGGTGDDHYIPPLVDAFYKSFDIGHWGPALGWLFYGTLLIWDGMGICYLLRRRFFEPLGILFVGLILLVVHVFVIQKCYGYTNSDHYPRDMCFSRNGAHIGLGLYGTLIGLYEVFLQMDWWHHRVGIFAPPEKNQYPYYLSPSLFIIVAMTMAGHEQSTMWNAMMHQYSGVLALILFLLRCAAYTRPRFSLVAGLIAVFGAFIFANASEHAYFYWMQIVPEGQDAFKNICGFPVSAIFLFLICACAALSFAVFNFACVYGYHHLPERYKYLTRASNWFFSLPLWTKYMYRLDQAEGHRAESQYDVLDPTQTESFKLTDREYADEGSEQANDLPL